ncbi:MAG: thiol:disulfide interchange protein DsbA/DsbL [Rhodanobacteraceae bacterium]|nr:thiol:disulfide interchange protein DsbA/DsbL [Xanthomonadales bacterium]MCP5478122.1 thiol:disulfide interchange protein DsbA/DsbL [Rhodanobacteraceae bacterium]HPF72890.1 thiol:disulfide interchange protein DsbA/DsbL [Xanthomonadaceae bacterium]HRX99131.1 thiol:disulfide interchange protein DsbA/DsbL [Xanthomonadaceae bacterium]
MFLRLTGLLALLISTAACNAQTPAAAPVEGEDYFLIENPSPPESGDKIEVIEVFSYACPHCADFQPFIDGWKKTQPADVDFQYIPAAFGNTWDDFARAFYTAQVMGILDKTHHELFKALHKDRRPLRGTAAIAAFYGDYGVDPKVFEGTMNSFAVNAKIGRSKQQVPRWQVDGTPTLVVDGKYRVVAGKKGFDGMLKTLDAVIVKARADRAAAKK